MFFKKKKKNNISDNTDLIPKEFFGGENSSEYLRGVSLSYDEVGMVNPILLSKNEIRLPANKLADKRLRLFRDKLEEEDTENQRTRGDAFKLYLSEMKNLGKWVKVKYLVGSTREIELGRLVGLKLYERDLISFKTLILIYQELSNKVSEDDVKSLVIPIRLEGAFTQMGIRKDVISKTYQDAILKTYEKQYEKESLRVKAELEFFLNGIARQYKFNEELWNSLKLIISGDAIVAKENNEVEELESEPEWKGYNGTSSNICILVKSSESMRNIYKSDLFDTFLIALTKYVEGMNDADSLELIECIEDGKIVTVNSNNIEAVINQFRNPTRRLGSFSMKPITNTIRSLTEHDSDKLLIVLFDTIIDRTVTYTELSEMLPIFENHRIVFVKLLEEGKGIDSISNGIDFKNYINEVILNEDIVGNTLNLNAVIKDIIKAPIV